MHVKVSAALSSGREAFNTSTYDQASVECIEILSSLISNDIYHAHSFIVLPSTVNQPLTP